MHLVDSTAVYHVYTVYLYTCLSGSGGKVLLLQNAGLCYIHLLGHTERKNVIHNIKKNNNHIKVRLSHGVI